MLRFFIILGNLGVPGLALLLGIIRPKGWLSWFFVLFVLIHSVARVWETFYTSKEKRRLEFHGDWPLVAVTSAYIILCFVIILEFFFMSRSPRFLNFLVGCILYGLAFRLRWWGMASLGKQWAIHAIGPKKIRKIRLIQLGPYKFIRHPIYLGIAIETISISIMPSCYLSLIFSITVCIPLIILRALLEERSSARRFGQLHQRYTEKIPMFLPVTKKTFLSFLRSIIANK